MNPNFAIIILAFVLIVSLASSPTPNLRPARHDPSFEPSSILSRSPGVESPMRPRRFSGPGRRGRGSRSGRSGEARLLREFGGTGPRLSGRSPSRNISRRKPQGSSFPSRGRPATPLDTPGETPTSMATFISASLNWVTWNSARVRPNICRFLACSRAREKALHPSPGPLPRPWAGKRPGCPARCASPGLLRRGGFPSALSCPSSGFHRCCTRRSSALSLPRSWTAPGPR